MLCSANITTFLLVTSVACRTRSRRHYHAIKERKRCELTEAAHIQSRICSEPWCKVLMNDGLCNRSEGLSYRCRRRNVTAGSRKLSADSQSNRTGVDDSKACCRSERSQGGVIWPPSTPPLQHTQLTPFRLQRLSEKGQHKNETSCSFNAWTHNNNSVITVREHYTQTGA